VPARPNSVLFACNLNRVRSPMAASLVRLRYGDTIQVDCCGLRAADAVDPFAVAVVDELGLDLSDYQPKAFDQLDGRTYDLVISLTPQAQHRAVELARGRPVEIEYWPTPDPTLVEGSRELRLEAYRDTRDALERRILERFGRPAGFGG
jgi:protein-tyrosine-phosphatase